MVEKQVHDLKSFLQAKPLMESTRFIIGLSYQGEWHKLFSLIRKHRHENSRNCKFTPGRERFDRHN